MKEKTNSVKVGKRTGKKKHSRRGQRRRGRPRMSKIPLVKKGRRIRRLRKKERCEYDDEGDADFIDNCPVLGEMSKKNGKRSRKYTVDSDSDFMPSGSSDYNYTISEEEREQVREANQLHRDLKTSLRSSTSVKGIQQNGDQCEQSQVPGRKGKEKVKEIKPEVGRQVCGICLSEENKRRFRGTLNCCSHYFCFACIMEWSKVESRCPCCKQRFKTITKTGRSTAGVDLRSLVIPVPKRDQVYQPSEEEIRNFIDPYENVICTECHEGGDDGLMLLCDLCDSPAHTYCVGLGRQVPEGNWYCNGCRPVALGSSNSQAFVPLIGQSTPGREPFNGPSPLANMGEGLDPIIESSPRVLFTQGFGNLSSPRLYNGDLEVASPQSVAGAPTLSGRRQLHRRIQDMLSNNRMNLMASRSHGILAANMHGNLSNSQFCQDRETTVQNIRTQEMGASQPVLLEERLRVNDHPSSSLQDRGPFFSRTNPSRQQEVQGPAMERPVSLTLWPELTGTNLVPSYEQVHQCNNRSSVGFDVNLSPYRIREESQFYAAKEQLGPVVKSHLKRLSCDIELGPDTFTEIARSSIHTILGACGLEHNQSEVHNVPPPLVCIHGDKVAAGETSLMKGFCSSCFDSFVGDVVKRIMDTKLPRWLSLAL
uniref:Uncharacterized protein MANES_08G113500 n=1 Tax=Rhizophora mucronata TaxID=61149 RepID=A0A2P2J5H4_RHIMU